MERQDRESRMGHQGNFVLRVSSSSLATPGGIADWLPLNFEFFGQRSVMMMAASFEAG